MKAAKILIIFIFVAAFVGRAEAQNLSFPNELKEYKFYEKLKLSGLRLINSTEKEVIGIYGQNCNSIKGCSYDENWSIRVHYYTKESARFKDYPNKKSVRHVPKVEFMGRISSIEFYPKKRLSFADAQFSNAFETQGGMVSRGLLFENPPSRGFIGTIIYRDSFGLEYNICQSDDENHFRKDDLLWIGYKIPDKIEWTMLVEDKQ